jgi:maleylacetate reductase
VTLEFVYEALPQRVLFGAGRRREVGDEVRRLGAARVFVIADRAGSHGVTDELRHEDGFAVVAEWGEAVQHVPEDLAERARAAATESAADVVVTVGGGSSTGLAKAIALSHRLPIVAVPTTYAGSEQTPIYGITGGRHKQTGKDPVVQPRSVVYDPELTLDLPSRVTGPSAFNALAHSVEALYAPGHNPVTTAVAMEGVRAIHRSLPAVMAHPRDVDARATLQYGAYLSGVALGQTAAAFHHKICHVLGGAFNLVHADSHSVVLPHAIAFNAPAVPDEMVVLAGALGCDPSDVAGTLWDLAVASGVPTSLAQLGLSDVDLPQVAALAAREITSNPRAFTEADLLGLLERAYTGERPAPTRGSAPG